MKDKPVGENRRVCAVNCCQGGKLEHSGEKDMTQMTYEEAEKYVLELPLHTKKNAFEETKAFYEWLGEPGSESPIIHVAGTNGKGSVCAYLNSILNGAGYRTGMFTSPHLVDIRERFVLDHCRIGKETFARLEASLLERLKMYKSGAYHPTFFETMFFLFMLWMQEEKPSCILLEAGIGGRLDVTNVIRRPAAAVITRIGLDHCGYLGDTKAKIAGEKAGIIKAGSPVICFMTDEEVNRVFAGKAQELSAPLVTVSKKEIAFSKLKKNYIDFFLESAYDRDIKARLNTTAWYQTENAALAVRTLEKLKDVLPVTVLQIQRGLERMYWEGRMEEIAPDVFLDGAHNPDGIRALAESVAMDGFEGQRWLVFGACADKSTGEMADILQRSGLFHRVMGTLLESGRSLTKQGLMDMFAQGQPKMDIVFEDAAHALAFVLSQKGEDTRVYIAGSLYLAGEVERYTAERKTEVGHDQF